MGFRKYLTGSVVTVMLTGAVIGAASLAPIGEASAQTLREALSEAYLTNPTLQSRRARLRATDEGVPQAKSGWRPEVSFNADVGVLDQESSGGASFTGSGDSTRDFYTLSLEVTQNVYNGGETEANVNAALSDVRAERARLRDVERNILQSVVSAYMNVVRDQAVLELTDQNLERLLRQLQATEDRFEVGEVTRTDVAQAESRVARARSDREGAAGDLEVSRAVYENLVGKPPGQLSQPITSPELPTSRVEANSLAEERSPSVLAAIYARRSVLRQIDGEFADLLPDVDIVGELSRSYDVSREGFRSDSAQLSARLTVPIYQQGFETSQLRQRKIQAAEALDTIEEARRSAVEQATSSWETYLSSLAVIKATREEVRAAEIALEGVLQEEAVGARTVLDVLDAEQELLDAQVSLVQAERDFVVAQYDLVSAVGGLSARDLGLDVPLYDEREYFEDVKDVWWRLGDEPERSDYDDAALYDE